MASKNDFQDFSPQISDAAVSAANSEAKYRRLFETISDAAVIFDAATGLFVDANYAAQKLYGYTKEEFLTLGHLAITAELEESASTLQQILKGTVERVPLRYHKKKDGTTFPAEIMTSTIISDGHTLVYGIIRDLTNLKQQVDELAAREKTLLTMLDSFPDLAMLLDKNGTVLAMNDAMAKHHQKSREQLVGTHLSDNVPSHIFEKRWQIVEKVLNSGMPVHFEDEFDGRILTHSFFPVFGSDGHTTGITVLASDITQERKSQEELKNYQEKMVRAEKLAAIGTMSAMLAHQLNQPLTVIRLLMQDAAMQLKPTRSAQSVTERIDETLNEVTKASTIVKNLLSWCRPPADNNRQSLNLSQIATRVIDLLSESARRADVKLVVNENLIDIPALVGSQMDFEQIFFILTENAIHAARNKKNCSIEISGHIDRQTAILAVSDNCGGIDPENIDKIFEPFFTTKDPDKGTGLGLAIVKQIVENYGGSVTVETCRGHGSAFQILLPLAMMR